MRNEHNDLQAFYNAMELNNQFVSGEKKVKRITAQPTQLANPKPVYNENVFETMGVKSSDKDNWRARHNAKPQVTRRVTGINTLACI